MALSKSALTRRSLLKSSAGAAAGLIAMPAVVNAQAADAVKLSLEFRIYGGNAPMFLAAENGIFRDLKLDVTSDGSARSGATLNRVAHGPYQFGLAQAIAGAQVARRTPEAEPESLTTVVDVLSPPSNLLSGSCETMEKNPDRVKRMALGCARGWVAADRDRNAAIAAVTKRDRLLRSQVEVPRIGWVLDRLIKTPEVKQNGIGFIDEKRLTEGLTVLADGLKFAKPVAVGDIYD